MYRRRKRRPPFAAYAALIFNAAICAAPFVGAKTMANAYGDHMHKIDMSDESMDATRRAIEQRFKKLAGQSGSPPRDVWTQLVREDLEAGDLLSVRGLLLAAPSMLGGQDEESLLARLAVSDGSGEDMLISAALAYLPEDVQAAYERETKPLTSQFEAEAVEAVTANANGDEVISPDGSGQLDEGFVSASTSSRQFRPAMSRFNVLGDLRDLSFQAARWMRNDRIDEFSFMLSGVGLILADQEARDGASILMSARRAERLGEEFNTYLERKLFLAAPPQRIERQLAKEFQNEYHYAIDGPEILTKVFSASVEQGALEDILQDMRIVHDIAEETSPMSAISILSQVHNSSDLRRARLITRAGGDRAVALAKHDGERLLDSARTVINWDRNLIIQVAGIAACLALLLVMALHVLWRAIRRNAPVRRSAVYALEEISAD